MTSIDELINNPTLTIEWLEPRPGAEADGTKTHAHVTLSATVGDVIRMARAARRNPGQVAMSDRELLEDFMVVHWANRKNEPAHSPYPPTGYVVRDNGIRGPGFSSWLEPVYTRPPTTTIPSHDQP
jgi:hypothetical protein